MLSASTSIASTAGRNNSPTVELPYPPPTAQVARQGSVFRRMLANTAEIRAGCLLEIRADAGYKTATDVDQLFDKVAVAVANLRGRGHVAIVDWRCCPLMAPVAAERMVQRIGAMNAHTVRSAALARVDAPSAVLQFVRLIREAGLADRRLFFDAEETMTWLGEVLTPEEKVRLRTFIGASAHGSRSP
jgi:hypothetical protein